MGRLTTVQMGKRPDNTFKQTRLFVYDTKGQLISASNPENGAVSYTYLADGLPESKTDAKNQKLWFYYDVKHRLTGISAQENGGPLTGRSTFTYDTNPNFATTYAQGRMTSAANDGYTWHFAYDIMGRVQKQTLQTPTLLTICDNPPDCTMEHTAPGHIQAQYGYDLDGRLADLYYPGGLAEASQVQPGTRYQYAYDLLARALSLSREYAPGAFELRAQNAQYNAASQITSWQEITDTYPATWHTLTRTYSDLRGWVSNIRAVNASNQALLDLTYGYLPNGRVSAVTDAVNPGQSVSSYEYDELNRLKKATVTNWALQWTYDEFGNRLTQTKVPGSPGTPPEITLSYGESTNRITTAGYTYDLNGNLTALPGLTIGYDVFDRAVTMNSSTAKYDAFGRRIFRQSGSTTRVYFYDLGGRLLAEYANLGSGAWPTRTLQYFAGQRLGDYTDRIGNVRFSRSTSGWRHYYPFGEEITGTSGDAYKFADLYRDADTGLDYAMARYHSSTIGRFLTVDPSAGSMRQYAPQSFNRYPYTRNDPLNFYDIAGRDDRCFPGVEDATSCLGGGDGSNDMQDPDAEPDKGGGFDPPTPPRLNKDRILSEARALKQRQVCGLPCRGGPDSFSDHCRKIQS